MVRFENSWVYRKGGKTVLPAIRMVLDYISPGISEAFPALLKSLTQGTLVMLICNLIGYMHTGANWLFTLASQATSSTSLTVLIHYLLTLFNAAFIVIGTWGMWFLFKTAFGLLRGWLQSGQFLPDCAERHDALLACACCFHLYFLPEPMTEGERLMSAVLITMGIGLPTWDLWRNYLMR